VGDDRFWQALGSGARIRRWKRCRPAVASVLETIAVRCPTRAGRGGRLIVPSGYQEVTPRYFSRSFHSRSAWSQGNIALWSRIQRSPAQAGGSRRGLPSPERRYRGGTACPGGPAPHAGRLSRQPAAPSASSLRSSPSDVRPCGPAGGRQRLARRRLSLRAPPTVIRPVHIDRDGSDQQLCDHYARRPDRTRRSSASFGAAGLGPLAGPGGSIAPITRSPLPAPRARRRAPLTQFCGAPLPPQRCRDIGADTGLEQRP